MEPSQVGSTRYVTRVINFIKLPRFSLATLKSWEESGYEASVMQYLNSICMIVLMWRITILSVFGFEIMLTWWQFVCKLFGHAPCIHILLGIPPFTHYRKTPAKTAPTVEKSNVVRTYNVCQKTVDTL